MVLLAVVGGPKRHLAGKSPAAGGLAGRYLPPTPMITAANPMVPIKFSRQWTKMLT